MVRMYFSTSLFVTWLLSQLLGIFKSSLHMIESQSFEDYFKTSFVFMCSVQAEIFKKQATCKIRFYTLYNMFVRVKNYENYKFTSILVNRGWPPAP